jgi:uncharacterized protein (DUF58 family)
VSERRFREGQAELAQQVAGLKFASRRLAAGLLAGLHRSVHRGGSAEFAEYAEYAAGDEPRTIDWKAVARTDRYFVKRFEETTNRRSFLLLDGSASMGFSRGARPSKLETGKVLLGGLATLLLRQGDAAGASVLRDGDDVLPIPPRARRSHLEAVLERLARAQARGRTDLARALDEVSPRIRRRSLVVLVSDLVDEAAGFGAALRRLRARDHDVVVIQVLDEDELKFPFVGTLRFRDPETEAVVTSDARVVAEGYRRELAAFLDESERAVVGAGAEHLRLVNSEDLVSAVLRFLARRQSLGRRLAATG